MLLCAETNNFLQLPDFPVFTDKKRRTELRRELFPVELLKKKRRKEEIFPYILRYVWMLIFTSRRDRESGRIEYSPSFLGSLLGELSQEVLHRHQEHWGG